MRRWDAWAATREWPHWITVEHLTKPLEYRLLAYAECQGPTDPVCGRARFSVHGCNGDGPSRAEFVANEALPTR